MPIPESSTLKARSDAWTPGLIEDQVHKLGDWFHNLHLRGVQTAPHHFLGDYPAIKWKQFSTAIPDNLQGKTVLDIGCNAGFYSLEMKRRGADRVIGIDSSEHYLQQARFAAEVEDLDIDFRQLSVYQVPDLDEQFDLVLFLGVFYHLRYPLLALDLLREHVVKDLLIVQSMLRGSSEIKAPASDYPFSEIDIFNAPEFPRMYFIEKRYSHDPTNWWIPNASCLDGMLRSAGFDVISRPEEEVFVCRPAGAANLANRRRSIPELLAAEHHEDRVQHD
jgi:tRNA (mo5U34)-methyltransferase